MRIPVPSLLVLAACALAVTVAAAGSPAHESSPAASASAEAAPAFTLETLLSRRLEGVAGTEVIVSRVTVPPNTALPKHWHPGEEFAYVLEGSVVLWQDGEPDTTHRAGDVVVIPLKKIHTAFTRDEGARLLVFRVHERGKPERVLVD